MLGVFGEPKRRDAPNVSFDAAFELWKQADALVVDQQTQNHMSRTRGDYSRLAAMYGESFATDHGRNLVHNAGRSAS
jgi:hypothetical protein